MAEPIIIGTNGVKFVKDSATKMITLNFPATSGTLSLHDDSATDYQVPVGKKLCILSIKTHGGAPANSTYGTPSYQQTGSGAYLYKNTTTDTTTGGTLILTNFGASFKTQYAYTQMGAGGATSPVPDIDCYIEVAAGNWVPTSLLRSFVYLPAF